MTKEVAQWMQWWQLAQDDFFSIISAIDSSAPPWKLLLKNTLLPGDLCLFTALRFHSCSCFRRSACSADSTAQFFFFFNPPRTLRLALSILKTGFILIQCCIQGMYVMPYSWQTLFKSLRFALHAFVECNLIVQNDCVNTKTKKSFFHLV